MVGIAAYTALPKLNNSVNDAKAIAKSLQDHGVEEKDIVFVQDGHIFTLNKAFAQFVASCKPGDLAFLFFAGHGCAFRNHQCLLARALTKHERNLLNDGNQQTILESSLQVEKMLSALRVQGITQHLLLLDCCREFRVTDLTRSTTTDPLKDVEPAPFNVSLGPGTTIGYVTAPLTHSLTHSFTRLRYHHWVCDGTR